MSEEEPATSFDAFEEGKEARFCSKPRDANPYAAGDERHASWAAGWDAADDPTNERTRGYS